MAVVAASVSFAQPSQSPKFASPTCSIVADLPMDVVRASSELLLTIAMTNISDRVMGVGCGFRPPIWTTFGIDIRDDEGLQSPGIPFGRWMHAGMCDGRCPGLYDPELCRSAEGG